jgi:hypothetical protein
MVGEEELDLPLPAGFDNIQGAVAPRDAVDPAHAKAR